MPNNALRVAIAALDTPQLDDAAKEELTRRVVEYVDVAQKAGWPPERMLVEVKRVLSDAGYHSRTIFTGKSRASGEAVVSEIVRMCIREYYGRSDREDAP